MMTTSSTVPDPWAQPKTVFDGDLSSATPVPTWRGLVPSKVSKLGAVTWALQQLTRNFEPPFLGSGVLTLGIVRGPASPTHEMARTALLDMALGSVIVSTANEVPC